MTDVEKAQTDYFQTTILPWDERLALLQRKRISMPDKENDLMNEDEMALQTRKEWLENRVADLEKAFWRIRQTLDVVLGYPLQDGLALVADEKISLEEMKAFFRRASALDPVAVSEIFKMRVPCNESMANDPHIICGDTENGFDVSVLGILNGLWSRRDMRIVASDGYTVFWSARVKDGNMEIDTR